MLGQLVYCRYAVLYVPHAVPHYHFQRKVKVTYNRSLLFSLQSARINNPLVVDSCIKADWLCCAI